MYRRIFKPLHHRRHQKCEGVDCWFYFRQLGGLLRLWWRSIVFQYLSLSISLHNVQWRTSDLGKFSNRPPHDTRTQPHTFPQIYYRIFTFNSSRSYVLHARGIMLLLLGFGMYLLASLLVGRAGAGPSEIWRKIRAVKARLRRHHSVSYFTRSQIDVEFARGG